MLGSIEVGRWVCWDRSWGGEESSLRTVCWDRSRWGGEDCVLGLIVGFFSSGEK